MWHYKGRSVVVARSKGMWLTWTDRREIEWFHEEHEAIQWAMVWAYLHRPAHAHLVTLDHSSRSLCSYAS